MESALWLALALVASIISIRLAISVALIEIVVGAIAGNTIGLPITEWVNFLAAFGAILLTFLAGTEIDPRILRKHAGPSLGIGVISFAAPYIGCMLYARYGLAWTWPEAQIAGISLSTTSVAVVYSVMVETGYNKSELGKIILAACFVTDLGTVIALGLVFAKYDIRLAGFVAVTLAAMWLLPRTAPWFFSAVGQRVSEPQTKFVTLVLFTLGAMASAVGSEAVLPAYLIGMALAPAFLSHHELSQRMRTVAFAILTPFYFLKAGSLVDVRAVLAGGGLILTFLAIKMITKFVGIFPVANAYEFERKEAIYTTLLMSTGLTFGSISALFGLTNHIIDQEQYTILVTAVIGSAVVPTLIAQTWFQPVFRPIEDQASVLEADGVAKEEP
jgi:Kef-type K+ transport system membrane component KefB